MFRPQIAVDQPCELLSQLRRFARGSEAMLLACDKANLEVLPEAEAALVAKATQVRQIQFASGRMAARYALRTLGSKQVTLRVGSMSEPLWPDGIVGSISHTNRWALAWVARRTLFAGLGVDIEHATHLSDHAWSLVLSKCEQRWTESRPDRHIAATALFSVKESIYKAVFPTVRRFVDFDEIELDLDLNNRLVARPAIRLAEELDGRQLQVDFTISGDTVASWAVLAAASRD